MISNSNEYRSHKRHTPEVRNRLKHTGGFTLIEVIVVIALMSIMAVVAAPSVREWHSNMTISKDTRDVFLAIKSARMKAISLSKAVTFTLDDATKSYTVSDADGVVHVQGIIDDEISITNNTIGGSVEFDSKGMPSTSGSFQLDNGKLYKTITLYLTGMTKLI